MFGDLDEFEDAKGPARPQRTYTSPLSAESRVASGSPSGQGWVGSIFSRAKHARRKAEEKLSNITTMISQITRESGSENGDDPLGEFNPTSAARHENQI